MPEPGSLPAADRPGPAAPPEAEAGALPAAQPQEVRPEDAALPPTAAPDEAPVEALDEAPAPEAPPLPEDRRERLREATARGGLDALPPGFADPDGDWRVAEAESPFERLYLDAAQHARLTPEVVRRHYDLLGTFWKEVVAGLDGPGAARIREKYGGEARSAEVVRLHARRTEEAYRRLSAEGGVEAAFAEVEAQRVEAGRHRLDPTLRGMLVDGELSPLETDALFRFGRQYGLEEDETADLLQDALRREGFTAYGDPQGDTLAERLRTVTWVTPERREALDRHRREARHAEVRPLKLENAAIASLEELVAYADAHPEHAARRLFDGTFGSWLSGTLGEVRLKDMADELSHAYRGKPAVGTEQFVRVLSAAVGRDATPHLRAGRDALALGRLPMGEAVRLPLTLHREGPRRAWGEVAVEGALPGLSAPPAFAIDDAEVPVLVDTLRVPPGEYEGALVVRPEGGAALRLPVSYTVAPLSVALAPTTLALGRVPWRTTRAKKLAVRCEPDGGRLAGTATLDPVRPGLAVQGEIDGALSVLRVVVDTAHFAAGDRYQGTLRLDTNAGPFEVPVSFRVEVAWGRVVGWMLVFAAALAAGLGFYRRFAADRTPYLRDFTPDALLHALAGRFGPEALLVFALLFVGVVAVAGITRALYRGGRRPEDPKAKRLKKAKKADG